MKLSLPSERLAAYVAKQIETFFPDNAMAGSTFISYIAPALERLEYCFSRINNKYFFDGSETVFNHLHSDQYAIFLYYLSNTIWRRNADELLASKVYYLNKALHALDAFYEVILPEVFLLVHPVGTVLGRGTYGNHFVAYQRCTVGANLSGEYPTIKEGTVLYGDSVIIGRSHLGKNSWVSAGSLLMDIKVPSDQVIFGRHPKVHWKPAERSVVDHYFR